MEYRLFNRVFFAILAALILPCLGIMFYMEPTTGELTRLGGYLENNYGENTAQEYFETPLFEKITDLDHYKGYYDVIVVGDSFSDNFNYGWQNYFANAMGVSMASFNMNITPLDEILASPQLKKTPPKLFIYQSVERNILMRHPLCTKLFANEKQPPSIDIKPDPLNIEPKKKLFRPEKGLNLEQFNFSNAINFVSKSLPRELLGVNRTTVTQFPLDRSNLFSNEKSDNLLVINKDFMLVGRTKEQINSAKCSLLSLQHHVENELEVPFVALFFPDKTTLYNPYVKEGQFKDRSIISQVESTENLNVASLYTPLKAAISNGEKDIYLPNDTHCSYKGYKIAADSLVSYLRESK